MKIGFELFSPQPQRSRATAGEIDSDANIAFVPLAMPLMFEPGAIATVLGIASPIRQSPEEIGSFAAA